VVWTAQPIPVDRFARVGRDAKPSPCHRGPHPADPAIKSGRSSGAPTGKTCAPSYPVLGDVIRAFKSISAIEINRILGRRSEAVWQRNYYEHIIRNLEEYERIRKYILENLSHWHDDPENVGL
jgi:hypothetical protein